jgi:hypothetical protein
MLLHAVKVALLAAAALAINTNSGQALQYRRIDTGDNKVLIGARGPVVEGDTDRLRDFLGRLPATDKILGVSADSPGGNIVEAEKLANVVRGHRLAALVGGNSECSSACFLLFAAGAKRFAGLTALVGVHTASANGQESLATMGITTAMAREAASFGVPPAIVGRMIQTAPGRIAWLTTEELTSMNVVILPAVAR